MKSIFTALFVEKVNSNLQMFGMKYDFITDGFSNMESWADRSDLAQLNEEFQSDKLKIIKEIPKKDSHYTHIIKDTEGYFFAIILKEGDWIEQFDFK